MKFTNYVATGPAGDSVYPLGYLGPSGEVSRALLRQFTFLSNHPAYEGFLAFAFSRAVGRSLNLAKRDFSKSVRDIEILWGG